jgi:hypothetical protein
MNTVDLLNVIEVELCPECGSGKVDSFQGNSKCKSCSWRGTTSSLLIRKMSNKEAHSVVSAVLHDYWQELQKSLPKTVGLALVRCGLCGMDDTEGLARLIKATVISTYKGTLEELDRLQDELKAHGKAD